MFDKITAEQFIKGLLLLVVIGLLLVCLGVYVVAGAGICLIVAGALLTGMSFIILIANS